MDRQRRLAGGFVLCLGLAGVLAGLASIAGGSVPGADGASCRAVCGWALLVEFLSGMPVGRHVAGALLVALGAGFSLAGLKILRN